MNWGQDPVSQVRLAGAVVASWSPKHEVTGWNNLFYSDFSKKKLRKNQIRLSTIYFVCTIAS